MNILSRQLFNIPRHFQSSTVRPSVPPPHRPPFPALTTSSAAARAPMQSGADSVILNLEEDRYAPCLLCGSLKVHCEFVCAYVCVFSRQKGFL